MDDNDKNELVEQAVVGGAEEKTEACRLASFSKAPVVLVGNFDCMYVDPFTGLLII